MPNDLFPPDLPEGLAYAPDVLTAAEETGLAARLETLAVEPFRFRGRQGLRQVTSFGWRYDFEGGGLKPAALLPDWLLDVRDRAGRAVGLDPERLEQLLVTRYDPGAPIGWHRDRPVFEAVAGVSLLSAARLRFRRREGAGWRRAETWLEPRSAYGLTGPARWTWEHSIPEAPALRWSLTFRSLRACASSAVPVTGTG